MFIFQIPTGGPAIPTSGGTPPSGGTVEDPYSLPIPQPVVQRRTIQDEINNHLSKSPTGSNGTNNLGTPRLPRTSDEFVLSMHNGNRDIASGENIVEGFITVGSARVLPRVAAYTGRGAGALGIAGRVTPWLAPVGGYFAYRDWESDYNNLYGTTTDENGDEINNSEYDVKEHLRALRESGQNITLTPAQERMRIEQLRSRRARDYHINTACTGAGVVAGVGIGVVWGIGGAKTGMWLGGLIGSFICPVVGTGIGIGIGAALGFVGGCIAGVCAGASIGNLVGSAAKGICNFFGGLFSGRARRGGYS